MSKGRRPHNSSFFSLLPVGKLKVMLVNDGLSCPPLSFKFQVHKLLVTITCSCPRTHLPVGTRSQPLPPKLPLPAMTAENAVADLVGTPCLAGVPRASFGMDTGRTRLSCHCSSGFSVFPSLLVKSHQRWRHGTNTIFLRGCTQLFLVGKIPCLFQVHTL